jgi:sugar (pentulose or hexulose) kinase
VTEDGLIAVFDMGKTLTKLSLWNRAGKEIKQFTCPNKGTANADYPVLPVEQVGLWLTSTLSAAKHYGNISAIIPVAHGAAAVLVKNGKVACAQIDYEATPPPDIIETYDLARGSFAETGSPKLADSLNLGIQLEWLENLHPDLFKDDLQILTLPQYWSWFLSGTASAELTSLGCHTDLWSPRTQRPSSLMQKRDWARYLPPLRKADEVVGFISRGLAEQTGLSSETQIYCGIHDSNAALQAARSLAPLKRNEFSVLSTGTWFVAMRSPGPGFRVADSALDQSRDCLLNVDMNGITIPSARFMGGREVELVLGQYRLDNPDRQAAIVNAISDVLVSGSMLLPTLAPGTGPFAESIGRWCHEPAQAEQRAAAVALYLALVVDAMLDLLRSRHIILLEGRFSRIDAFARALATLRPKDRIMVAQTATDVAFGALTLALPELQADIKLRTILPLGAELDGYKRQWNKRITDNFSRQGLADVAAIINPLVPQ